LTTEKRRRKRRGKRRGKSEGYPLQLQAARDQRKAAAKAKKKAELKLFSDLNLALQEPAIVELIGLANRLYPDEVFLYPHPDAKTAACFVARENWPGMFSIIDQLKKTKP
jgi:hypothetical protein